MAVPPWGKLGRTAKPVWLPRVGVRLMPQVEVKIELTYNRTLQIDMENAPSSDAGTDEMERAVEDTIFELHKLPYRRDEVEWEIVDWRKIKRERRCDEMGSFKYSNHSNRFTWHTTGLGDRCWVKVGKAWQQARVVIRGRKNVKVMLVADGSYVQRRYEDLRNYPE